MISTRVDHAVEELLHHELNDDFDLEKFTRSLTVKSASESRLVRAMNWAPLRPTATNLAGVLMSGRA
jgi:hypothetical protein